MATTTKTNGKPTAIADVSNDAAALLEISVPYIAEVTIEGTVPILFHRWSCEDVEAKGAASKGSRTKKTDNVEAYVYRCADKTIGIPGEYLRQAGIHAAKFRQDPRSPRKSAMDLYKAALIPLTETASLGKTTWDYLDQRRVTIQRSAITRMRPAFLAGWQATFEMQVALPEYIPPADLLSVLVDAGRLVGLADNRPSYGRFNIVQFKVIT